MRKTATRFTAAKNKHPVLAEAFHLLGVIVGGVLVGFGLEAFLIPNDFLDGGITGIAIILSHFVDLPMGVFLAVLNLPFVLLVWWKVGHRSAIRTAVGIATLATVTIVLHHMDPLTENFLLALFFGGALLGLGIGIALRQGGALDGTEALASIVSNRSAFSVDQIILGINVIIFTVAAFVISPESAMASAALFFLAVSPMIKRVVDGNSEMKAARVITAHPEPVAAAISSRISRRISADRRYVYEEGRGFEEEVTELFFTVARLEESEVTELVLDADPDAVVIFNEVSSLRGGVYEDRAATAH